MILETIDECESCAYAYHVFVYPCHNKLFTLNNESALVKIITQDKIFVMYMKKVET